jgi:hypothetical protein
MVMLQRDPELHEPASREDLFDLRAEINELHERIDGLLEVVEVIAHDHYRPLRLPEARMTSALHRARRSLSICISGFRR